MRKRKCSAVGCPVTSFSHPTETLIRFPSDPQRFQLWCEVSGYPNDDYRKNIELCHRHFSQEAFYDRKARRRLIAGSNPCFPTGDLNPLTCDYSPVVEQGATSPEHEQTLLDSDNESTCSSCPGFGGEAHLVQDDPPNDPETEEMDLDGLKTVNFTESEHISTNPIVPDLSRDESSLLQNPKHLVKLKDFNFDLLPAAGSSGTNRIASRSDNKKLLVLRQLGLSRLSQLSRGKVKLFQELKQMRKNLEAIKKNLAQKSLKLQATNFQIRCLKRKQCQRRWTLGEKLTAVALFKHSPRTYKFLQSIFVLPKPRTLTTMINKVPMKTGINAHMFEQLKKRVSTSDDERYAYCSLTWDKMSFEELFGLFSCGDEIYGYEDLGNGKRSYNRAQHVLVFTAVGHFHKWKQPLAFYFTSGGMESQSLVDIIMSVISNCHLVGLKVRTTVCENHTLNRKALLLLGSKLEKPYFMFEGFRVFTLFDPTHLLKCTRNMLVEFDLLFPMANHNTGEQRIGTARWNDILNAVEEDTKSHVRLMRKLTSSHLQPTGPSAMKVDCAAQVLSGTVAAAVETFVRFKVLDSTAMATSEACSFFNKLFDSLNGYKSVPEGADGLRTRLSITRQSNFYNFWDSAIIKLSKMKFVTKLGKTASTPTLMGWVQTINAVKLLWETLLEEVPGTTFLELRWIH